MLNFKQIIKTYFSKNKFSVASCCSFLNKFNDIKQEAQKILIQIPEYTSLYHIIEYNLKDIQLPKCIKCGNLIDANKAKALTRRGGNYFCKKCLSQPSIKREIGLNSLPKFKATMLERYGVEFTAQSKQLDKKREETCLKKYGTKYAQSSDIVKNKIKNTLIQNIGFQNFTKVIKNSNLNKYLDYLEPLFDINDFINNTNKSLKKYKWKCKKCGNVFEDHIHKTMHIPQLPYLPRCLKCYPYLTGDSNQQKELVNFIKSIYHEKVLENDRNIISPYELDIVIPEKNIAFEYNGSFWHSTSSPGYNEDKNKCLMKTELCQKVGYKLIHIWEYDWINPFKQNILKEKIKAILGIDQTKIYARKCIIKEISNQIKNDFLNLNHIQGEDKSKIKLGLFYNDALVAVMTFGKPRFNKKYEYELIRYATKSGYQVLGGAGKLLKYFELNYHPKSLITYADRCYSQGNMYRKIGFTQLKPSSPGYVWTNGVKTYSRYECQKHKLAKLLGDKFDNNLSESENMINARFYKVYDCGNLVFEKSYV